MFADTKSLVLIIVSALSLIVLLFLIFGGGAGEPETNPVGEADILPNENETRAEDVQVKMPEPPPEDLNTGRLPREEKKAKVAPLDIARQNAEKVRERREKAVAMREGRSPGGESEESSGYDPNKYDYNPYTSEDEKPSEETEEEDSLSREIRKIREYRKSKAEEGQ